MTEPTKVVAILSGGDWYDASVDHVVVPPGLNLDAAKSKWNAWHHDVYYPEMETARSLGSKLPEYFTFPKYLIEFCGARDAGDDDVLVVEA